MEQKSLNLKQQALTNNYELERLKKSIALDLSLIHILYTIRQLNVITKPGGIPKRTLIAFSFSNRECVVEERCV